jgi:hypothetical protein
LQLHVSHGELVIPGERVYFIGGEDIYKFGTDLGRHLMDDNRLQSVFSEVTQIVNTTISHMQLFFVHRRMRGKH